jgi:hypothetical protein
LTGDRKANTILISVKKFLDRLKNNQLLTTTRARNIDFTLFQGLDTGVVLVKKDLTDRFWPSNEFADKGG